MVPPHPLLMRKLRTSELNLVPEVSRVGQGACHPGHRRIEQGLLCLQLCHGTTRGLRQSHSGFPMGQQSSRS